MKASLEIEFGSPKQAQHAVKALEQETEFKKRGGSKIAAKGSELHVAIETEDIVALRATLNSYLRLLQIIKGIDKTADGGKDDD